MPNYEVKIQVNISATEQAVTLGATPSAGGSCRMVIEGEAGQSIDHCEHAL